MTPANTTPKKVVKKRHWAWVLYPESAPADWREQLQARGLVCAISPLHDKDTDPEPNNPDKKPHYHIIATWQGPTAYSVVKSITDSLGQPIPQAVESIRGYYRYLTHKDNPDKYQYDEREITTINGFNIIDFMELTRAEIHAYKIQIQEYIESNNVDEYHTLLIQLLADGLTQLHEIAINHTILFHAFLRSKRHSKERQEAVAAAFREAVTAGIEHELRIMKLRAEKEKNEI
jgi:hypothetical protein